ncbi:MAG: M48 family metallopeptidase [Candidatus Hydrogenedentota bacterium]
MWEQISANRRNSAFLVVLMAGLLFVIGYLFGEVFIGYGGGIFGLFIAFILWIFLILTSYFGGDNIFLAISGAREIQKKDHPILFNIVEEMTIAAGLPKVPRVFIIDDDAPNAFATGRTREVAAVAVTSGLLERLNRDELQGVIAHELAHINNRDTLYMIMVGVMMGAIVLLADIGVRSLFYGGRRSRSSRSGGGQAELVIFLIAIILMILAPIIAQLIYFAISRKREYLADASAAVFTRYPEGLASALEKISNSSLKLSSATKATAPMYIVNPLAMKNNKISDLTSTHPPISERVKILRSMAGGAGFTNYEDAYKRITGRPVGVIPFSTLKDSKDVLIKEPSKEDKTKKEKQREIRDLIWKVNDYKIMDCECGIKLKIPPSLLGKKIQCPKCLRIYNAIE